MIYAKEISPLIAALKFKSNLASISKQINVLENFAKNKTIRMTKNNNCQNKNIKYRSQKGLMLPIQSQIKPS